MRKPLLCLALLLPLFATQLLSGDETFSDQATWEASLTGTDQFETDYSALDNFETLQEVTIPLPQVFGNIELVDSGNAPASGIPFDVPFPFAAVVGDGNGGTIGSGLFFPAEDCVVVTLDSAVGTLEGFGFEYSFGGDNSVQGDLTVTVFDANDNVIDTLAPAAPADPETGAFFGWINCDGSVAARIEICSTVGFNLITGDTYSFNPVSADPTCQDLLQDIIDELNAIYPLASADDQYWINWAINDLTCAQDSTFWETEDRLSDYGTGFFSNVFWATYDLECVSDDMLAEGSLIAIQDLLSCVVDNEIEYAVANGANENLIQYANFFESFADAYSEAGLYLHAVLLHFYAWLFANC